MTRPDTLVYFAWCRTPLTLITAHGVLVGCFLALLLNGDVQGSLRTGIGIAGLAMPALYWCYAAGYRAFMVRRWKRAVVVDILGRRVGPLQKQWPETARAGLKAGLAIVKRYPWAYHPKAFWYMFNANTLHMRWRSGQTYVDIDLGDTVKVVAGDDEGSLTDQVPSGQPLPGFVLRTLRQLTA